jgi:hypothetical protein
MSLRPSEAPPLEAPPPPPLDAPVVATTGCGPSAAFGGAVIPCGVLCCYGSSQTLASAYIITSRGMGELNGSGMLVNRTSNPPRGATQVKTALSAVHPTKYHNVYSYQILVQGEDFDPRVCMDDMGVEDWTGQMTGGGLDKAYAEVHAACTAAYGSNYAMYSFKK